MKQSEVIIGGTYRCRVGNRIATVTVDRAISGRRTSYQCTTHDTGRTIKASAARLRPLHPVARPATPPKAPRPFKGHPGNATVDLGPGRFTTMLLSAANRAYIGRIVDNIHCAETPRYVARVVRHEVGTRVIWATIPRALRRGLLYFALERHAANATEYRYVMGHAPLPSPRAVAEAVGIACGLGPMPLG